LHGFSLPFVLAQAHLLGEWKGPIRSRADRAWLVFDRGHGVRPSFQQTLYRDPDDYVFAANSSRAGKKRGKQPLWLSTIMRYYIQPVVKRLGIKKRVTWHTFRRTYTTRLHANGETWRWSQELLRHSSSRITMDIYAQAQMPAKRAAQQKVVEMMRSKKPALEAKMMA
jgi:integrase